MESANVLRNGSLPVGTSLQTLLGLEEQILDLILLRGLFVVLDRSHDVQA